MLIDESTAVSQNRRLITGAFCGIADRGKQPRALAGASKMASQWAEV